MSTTTYPSRFVASNPTDSAVRKEIERRIAIYSDRAGRLAALNAADFPIAATPADDDSDDENTYRPTPQSNYDNSTRWFEYRWNNRLLAWHETMLSEYTVAASQPTSAKISRMLVIYKCITGITYSANRSTLAHVMEHILLLPVTAPNSADIKSLEDNVAHNVIIPNL